MYNDALKLHDTGTTASMDCMGAVEGRLNTVYSASVGIGSDKYVVTLLWFDSDTTLPTRVYGDTGIRSDCIVICVIGISLPKSSCIHGEPVHNVGEDCVNDAVHAILKLSHGFDSTDIPVMFKHMILETEIRTYLPDNKPLAMGGILLNVVFDEFDSTIVSVTLHTLQYRVFALTFVVF